MNLVKDDPRLARVEDVNKVIKLIGDHGRRFFYYPAYTGAEHGTYSYFAFAKQHLLMFVDGRTLNAINPENTGRWERFSHGGTLREMVVALAQYVNTGEPIPIDYICTPRRDPANGNIWGYPDTAAESLRAAVMQLPVFTDGGPP